MSRTRRSQKQWDTSVLQVAQMDSLMPHPLPFDPRGRIGKQNMAAQTLIYVPFTHVDSRSKIIESTRSHLASQSCSKMISLRRNSPSDLRASKLASMIESKAMPASSILRNQSMKRWGWKTTSSNTNYSSIKRQAPTSRTVWIPCKSTMSVKYTQWAIMNSLWCMAWTTSLSTVIQPDLAKEIHSWELFILEWALCRHKARPNRFKNIKNHTQASLLPLKMLIHIPKRKSCHLWSLYLSIWTQTTLRQTLGSKAQP